MSLIAHSIFPRSMLNVDQWLPSGSLTPSNLDLFDPFDELDNLVNRNINWLHMPQHLVSPVMPKVPQKYRVSVDCRGFKPESIKIEMKDHHKMIISGHEEQRVSGEDYSSRRLKKTVQLPANSDAKNMVSFMTRDGHLIVEVPLTESKGHSVNDLLPKIVDLKNGGKEVQMKFTVPENVDPTKVTVSVKDRDIILRAEDRTDKSDTMTRVFFYKVKINFNFYFI